MKVEPAIKVYGAREHNLHSVTVEIPKNKLVIITGPSGSGKSSLALDTLYAEGRRRYIESLSSYARQFLGVSKKPDVDKIEGLCPSIAIDQKTVGYNPRSTVGTTTEIYDYMRVLFARIGLPQCPQCAQPIHKESPQTITQMVLQSLQGREVTWGAPLAIERKGEFTHQLKMLFDKGYYRFIVDGKRERFRSQEDIEKLNLLKMHRHTIDVLLDQFVVTDAERVRVQEAIEKAFVLTQGFCKVSYQKEDGTMHDELYAADRICVLCGSSFPELEPRLFSFNSPLGACKTCHGLGLLHVWRWRSDERLSEPSKNEAFNRRWGITKTCPACLGNRLCPEAQAVYIDGKNIVELSACSIEVLSQFFNGIALSATHQLIAEGLLKEIQNRLAFLQDVGLSYLTLSRTARTLSGGESQRIRLATQIGSALSGVLYVLDEPSIGLHQRDNDRLIATLKRLRDQGNTVLVVEHDMDTIKQSDYVVDMGPAAGMLGGNVVAVGTPAQIAVNKQSLTGQYLIGTKQILAPQKRRKVTQWLTLSGVRTNNLRNITASFPLGVLTGVSGVSGSGKSSLVMQTLAPALKQYFSRGIEGGAVYESMQGVEHIRNCVQVDQSPIGRTPRSNPATYVGIFDEIRALFALMPESKARGYDPGRFSFNVAKGRCSKCRGEGKITIEMHFLENVEIECKSCQGRRYSSQTLEILFNGKTIADILAMPVQEAAAFFANFPRISKRLRLLCDVGLDYLTLGQPSTTLSGGEAQRIKLVNELAKRGNNTLYILDEPTTGLHSDDVVKLIAVLQRLVEHGNTVIVIEHNLDILKSVDYLIDIGPEGGDKGGVIVSAGTPEDVSRCKESFTARCLMPILRFNQALQVEIVDGSDSMQNTSFSG